MLRLDEQSIFELMKLNDEAKEELDKVDEFEFDIFKLRDVTNANELVTLLSYLVVHQGLHKTGKVDFERLLNYMTAIQSGYKNIAYHNKTHAADLCQTFHYFCKQGLQQVCAIDS